MIKLIHKGTLPCMGCQNCSFIMKGPNIHHPTKGNDIHVKDVLLATAQTLFIH